MDIIQVITKELNVEKWQVEAAVKLIDEGCTTVDSVGQVGRLAVCQAECADGLTRFLPPG